MTKLNIDLQAALGNVSASSAGGAPFLIAYGLTFFITAILTYFLPRPTVALIAMFQGGVALPLAFYLERRMRFQRKAPDNPLQSLSGQMAFSQVLGLPALIVAYSLNPGAVPVMLASLGGVHFLPYAWLHRTRIYIVLAVAVSVGAFALQVLLGSAAFAVILFYVALLYWVVALLVYRHAAGLMRETMGSTGQPAAMSDGD